MVKHYLFPFLFIAMFFACKSNAPVKPTPLSEASTSPNSCRIEATVIEILPISSSDTADVCFRYPCQARVHIDKIIQCGHSIALIADEQDEMILHFVYSLQATAETIPKLQPSYPGLKKGTRFVALVEQRIALGDKNRFLVYDYRIIQ